MGREVGHDTSLLDVGGGFPGAEGSEPEFEEVREGREGDCSLGLGSVCVSVQGAFVTDSYACV